MAQAPVKRNHPFTGDNRHGALQDVNNDNQVSFADTFLGDLLGMDGQGGVQGPGMRDSMSGARRQQAIAMLQERGAPMTEQNVQRAMQMTDMGPGGGAESMRPQMRPDGVGPATAPVDPTVQTDDQMIDDGTTEDDMTDRGITADAAMAATIAALVARAARGNRTPDADAARNELTAMGRGLDGEILDPARVPAARNETPVGRGGPTSGSDDIGVELNYSDGRNALPSPAMNNIDPSNSPISTEALMDTPSAQQIAGPPDVGNNPQALSVLPEGSQMLGPRPDMGNLQAAVGPDGVTYLQGRAGTWMPIDINSGLPSRQAIIKNAIRGLF
jgi:hypothetical protein